ncbi:MAG: F0F1 ATP synthase subunit A [Oscillospiraceae bacterium]|nr:F0F1 ATP synthase subunit A [Oscillospiraceae bacterium]MDD4367914.1 F0F1 ATP synthase subunit A [Oscillospiraceae bacterium]
MLVMLNYFQEFGKAFLDQLKSLLPGQSNLTDGITELLDFGARFSIRIGSLSIPISDTLISLWIAMILMVILGVWLGYKPKEIPDKKQTVAELLIGALQKLCHNAGLNDKQSQEVVPFVGTVGIYILIANVISIFKLRPPAQNPAFPVALALFDIIYVLFMGFRFVGIKGFWGSISQPMPALVPFKLLDYIIKPVSLAFRLFGNIFGSYILIEFVSLVIPIALPAVLGLWFDLADGIIQALVFVYLTITYVGEIVEGAESAREIKAEKAKAKALKLAAKMNTVESTSAN